MKRAVFALAAALALLGASPVQAQIPPMLRSGTSPYYFLGGMGPAAGVDNISSQFKLTQEVGYHFSGDASGPALAGETQQAFGSGFFVFNLGPKFVYDIPIVEGLGLYLSPSFMLGLLLYSGGGSNDAGVTIQPAFRAKLVLDDRGIVFFQPFGFDISTDGDRTFVRYDLLFGGGLIF